MKRPHDRDAPLLKIPEQHLDLQVEAVNVMQVNEVRLHRIHPLQEPFRHRGRPEASPVREEIHRDMPRKIPDISDADTAHPRRDVRAAEGGIGLIA